MTSAEIAMSRFKWHAEYFDEIGSVRCARKMTIEADNASEAERIAIVQMAQFARVEVRRMGTPAPGRVIYARKAPARTRLPRTEAFPLARLAPAMH
jgi:hypothetical protein